MSAASFSTLIRNFVLGDNYFVRLYDEGLEISQEQTDRVRWGELRALVIGENQNSFDLILRDGRRLVVTKPPRNSKHYEWQRGYEDVKLDIDYQLVRRTLPDLLRRLGEGDTLEFGSLKITQAGLQVAEHRLAWDKFSTLAFDFPRIGKKRSNPTPVQFYQHATPRLW